MHDFYLDQRELNQVQQLVAELCVRGGSVESPQFLSEAFVLAQELPRRLRRATTEFRLSEPRPGLFAIRGYVVDDAKIGPTPPHWRQRIDLDTTRHEQTVLILFASLLGDVFGWKTEQDGHIIHDVLPIREHETEQISTASLEPIWWHIEDAFHPMRGDYLGLICLRNPDRIATTYAWIDTGMLDQSVREVLSQPRFVIWPDKSHVPALAGGSAPIPGGRGLEGPAREHLSDQKVALLFGDSRSGYLRLDPYFMKPLDRDPEAAKALQALSALINSSLDELVLGPGDICFVDNYRTVHGRRPFHARYDGSDRWLKRVNITRDLRKSRAYRDDCTSRIIC